MAENAKINMLFGSDESTKKSNRVELCKIRYCDTPAGTMEIESVAVPLNRIDKHGKATTVHARRLSRMIKSVHMIAAKGVSIKDDVPESWQTRTIAILTLNNGKTALARLAFDRKIDKYVIKPMSVYPLPLETAKDVVDYRVALLLEVYKIHVRNKTKKTLVIEGFSFVR